MRWHCVFIVFHYHRSPHALLAQMPPRGPKRKRPRKSSIDVAAHAASSSADPYVDSDLDMDSADDEESWTLSGNSSQHSGNASDPGDDKEDPIEDLSAIVQELDQMFIQRPPMAAARASGDAGSMDAKGTAAAAAERHAPTAPPPAPSPASPAPPPAPAAAAESSAAAARFYGPNRRTYSDEVRAAHKGKEELLRRRRAADERKEGEGRTEREERRRRTDSLDRRDEKG